MATRPASRDEFEVAIVCARGLEYDAVALAIDEFWDEDGDRYGKAAGDPNTYTTGRIGNFNIVLALLSNIGKVSAASAATSLRLSYLGLTLVLVTGICGGVPNAGTDDEMVLGDVVISKTVVQYDLGKRFPDGFVTTDTVEDGLGRPAKNVRNLVAICETDHGRERLERRAAEILQEIQSAASRKRRGTKYRYPGAAQDYLFEASYRHKHQLSPTCLCAEGSQVSGGVCEESRKSSCDKLKCDDKYLVPRDRLKRNRELELSGRGNEAQSPCIFVGRIASGDIVLKSGEDRDRLAACRDVIAFEMEGAGVWDEGPCLVVKGVCDYADSHKNKKWQDFAAATAASVMKALLERYVQTDKPLMARPDNTRRNGLPGQPPDHARNRARDHAPGHAPGHRTVFNGPVSGTNVITGFNMSGGTANFSFTDGGPA